MKQVGVGILGFGTVGAGVADGLLRNRAVMAERLGVDIVLRKIADLDITTDRGVAVDPDILTTDAQGVIADASAALWLSSHGRSADIGVDAKPWRLNTIQVHEFAGGHRQAGMRVSEAMADLTSAQKGAKVLSRLYNRPAIDAEPVYVAPGAMEFTNARGGKVVTLAQPLPPAVPISYAQTMLSESYKDWIVGLLRDLGGSMPGGVYYLGDGPATCLSGVTDKGERIVVLNLLDLDGDDAPEFVFDSRPASIERLRGDGTWEQVEFAQGDGAALKLKTVVKTQMPAIFRIK